MYNSKTVVSYNVSSFQHVNSKQLFVYLLYAVTVEIPCSSNETTGVQESGNELQQVVVEACCCKEKDGEIAYLKQQVVELHQEYV